MFLNGSKEEEEEWNQTFSLTQIKDDKTFFVIRLN